MIVTLNPQDASHAAMVGMRRQLFALARGLRNKVDTHDAWELGFDYHIFGAMSEFVVARILNLFWEPRVGEIGKLDVGGLVEVRLRRLSGNGTDLVIKTTDEDDTPVVLVHSNLSLTFDIRGWLYAKEGKERGDWNDQRGHWFVKSPYRPIEELIELCRPALTIITRSEAAQ